MTKAQQIAQLQAQLTALAGQPVMVEPIPDQAATAPTSPWITAAQAAVPAKAPKVYAPKPLKIGYVGIFPKEGATGDDVFEPYTMLSIENHAHGKAHRSIRLSQRYLDEILSFVQVHGRHLPKPRKAS